MAWSARRHFVYAGACDGTVAMHLHRAAAIVAGAVPSLCAVLQAGAARRVPVALDDVLRALYALAASDSSGHSASELFASGGVHSLVSVEFHSSPLRIGETLKYWIGCNKHDKFVAHALCTIMTACQPESSFMCKRNVSQLPAAPVAKLPFLPLIMEEFLSICAQLDDRYGC